MPAGLSRLDFVCLSFFFTFGFLEIDDRLNVLFLCQSFFRPASDRPARDWTASLVNGKLCTSTRACSLGWSSGNVRKGCLENLLRYEISSITIKHLES